MDCFHTSILKEWAWWEGPASHNPDVFCFFLIAVGLMSRDFTAVSTEEIFHHTLSVCHHHFPMYFRIIQSITEALRLLTLDSACNAQINSNVKNPHWEAGGRSASHTVPSLLLNPEVHYWIHDSSPLAAILSQTNPGRNHKTVPLRSILTLSPFLSLLISSLLTEQSPSWEANRFSASQEIPAFYGNRIHKCPPPVPILSHIDPVHVPTPISWRSIWVLSSHLRLGLPSDSFPQVSPPKPRLNLSSPAYVLHAPPISSDLFLFKI